jgi:hypothetical protein
VHNFLDFRSEASSKKPSSNLPLIRLAGDIYDRVYAVERKGKPYPRTKISQDVQQVARMVQSDLPEAAQALREYAAHVKNLQVNKPSPFRHFQKLWGRGQQYISFVIRKSLCQEKALFSIVAQKKRERGRSRLAVEL